MFGVKTNIFGYPSTCSDCKNCNDKCELNVDGGFYKEGNETRLMLVGQEPTIRKDKFRVKVPLMLNDNNSQIYKWFSKSIFGVEFDYMTIYATNIVKCTFDKPPSEQLIGGKKYLEPYYYNCKKYLREEISNFKPTLLIGLGEPVHFYLSEIFGESSKNVSMQNGFTGEFKMVSVEGTDFKFLYSPCLHIQTFRVAETYGDSVKKFKEGIKKIIKTN